MPNSEFARLVEIMKRLRGPKGCPWDLEQDHASLKTYLLEETHEVLDAIDSGDASALADELGDLLLQVVFHAQIASENKEFTIVDVARGIADKMVRRHPHIFGNVKADDVATVLKNWDDIKATEKSADAKEHTSILAKIPKGLPALFECLQISKKVAKLGFDWQKPSDVFVKIDEEVAEVKKAVRSKKKSAIAEELGDLLFTVGNLCRAYDVNPEVALISANRKFRRRFTHMERALTKDRLAPKKITLKTWDELWRKAKQA